MSPEQVQENGMVPVSLYHSEPQFRPLFLARRTADAKPLEAVRLISPPRSAN